MPIPPLAGRGDTLGDTMNGQAATAGPSATGGTGPAPAATGLSQAEADRRLRRDGPNLLPQPERRNWRAILGGVVREPMLLLLAAASALYLLLGDAAEAAALAASFGLVVALTAFQEYRSERALQALRDLSSPNARVLRDGALRALPARDLVVGDVVRIVEGDRVPADARLLEATDLMLDESMLTGESVPVARAPSAHATAEEGWVRAGTLAVHGHGLAEITATGAATAIGRIGASLRAVRSPPTPLQADIRRAVVAFAILGIGFSLLVALVYGASRGDWLQGTLAGITLAMANIPEEFPVVLAVFLALGAWRMARHRALIRRPHAIEALGAVTVLCTDKTGTLTENRMTVAELACRDAHAVLPAVLPPPLEALLSCADAASGEHAFDPLDASIRAALPDTLRLRRKEWQRIREYPLSSELLATAHVWRTPTPGRIRVFCKGAPEAVAGLCRLPPAEKAAALEDAGAMAQRGLRVIAAATAEWGDDGTPLPADARGFAFAWSGLLGMADPLRAGVRDAVAEARAAGIRVLMLTGDHVETARAIALQAGLSEPRKVVLGRELETPDDAVLRQRIQDNDVFARTKPEHKLRLVDALTRSGQVVAMTGDGVNDAPALVAAHVGIAMGGRGTDVAREAASIVLLDDNFVTILAAIRDGRTIYDNIVRAVRYILAVHVPITGLALLPLLWGQPLVLLPLHVVFLELIIDPASTLVFEREPAAADVMRRPPRPPTRRLLDGRLLIESLGQGLAMFAAVATVYVAGLRAALPEPQLAAAAFIALVVGNLGLIVLNRTGGTPVHWWRRRNPAFWTIAIAALSMLFAITHFQTPGGWFHFAPPPPLIAAAAALTPLAALGLVEAWRLIRAGRHRVRP